jgi:EAL and modified HD-GYP domain-containing signal transduction protein
MQICLARQPIFDRDQRIVAYELLFRRAADAEQAEGATPDAMSSRVVVDAVLGMGLEQVTEGRPAFLNFSRELLLSDAIHLIDPRQVVIEILEHVGPDEEVIAACERLRGAGYRIAMDDFTYSPAMEPLLALADTVKVDVLMHEPDSLARTLDHLAGRGITLLAEKVETPEVLDDCERLGFTLFQGYFYGRPQIMADHDISLEQLNIVQLLNLVANERAPDHAIENALRADVGLSYKLLRIVNSAAMGGRGIDSIGHALRLLGRTMLHRWLALLLVATVSRRSDGDRELVYSALLRARMAELIGLANHGPRDPSGLYLVGLLSSLDALLRVPMDRILSQLDLIQPVKDALLARQGEYGRCLQLIEKYQEGAWREAIAGARELQLGESELAQCYLDALSWARQRLAATSSL